MDFMKTTILSLSSDPFAPSLVVQSSDLSQASYFATFYLLSACPLDNSLCLRLSHCGYLDTMFRVCETVPARTVLGIYGEQYGLTRRVLHMRLHMSIMSCSTLSLHCGLL